MVKTSCISSTVFENVQLINKSHPSQGLGDDGVDPTARFLQLSRHDICHILEIFLRDITTLIEKAVPDNNIFKD